MHHMTDLEERVRRLEVTVAALQAQIEGGALPIDPDEPPPREARDLEATLGTYWLSRAGILALITGLAWFIALHFGDLGPALRVVLGYGLSALIAAVGLWFSRTQRLFGHVVFGGGLAVGYFVTYALHFVDSVRVIDSQLIGLVLLAVAIAVIAALAQHLSSETTAGIAFFLGFHTTLVGSIDVFALLSATMLACAAAWFFVRNRWIVVPLSSLVAVYSSHAIVAMRSHEASRFHVLCSLGLICVYFLVFAVAVLLRPRQLTARIALGFSLLDTFAFVSLGAATCMHADRGLLATFLLVAAGLVGACAVVARTKDAPLLTEVYASSAAATLALAMAEAFGPWIHALGIAALGGGVVYASARLRMRVLGMVGSALVAVGAILPWPERTLSWVLAAAILVGLGLALRERLLRFAGLGVVALAALKLLVFDFADLPTDQRILTFVVSGAVLLGLSFAYARFKDKLERLL
jgi:hypothetical protein